MANSSHATSRASSSTITTNTISRRTESTPLITITDPTNKTTTATEEEDNEGHNRTTLHAFPIVTAESSYGAALEREFEVHDIDIITDITPAQYDSAFSFRKLMCFAGPGFAMSIAYLDPGNICSDLHCGAVAGYKLIWLLFLTHLLGLYVQTLSARIGIVTGQSLAQHCRTHYPPLIRIPLWLLCELAIIGSDIQEAIGTAIALYLLLGIPIWTGILLASVLSYVILGVQQFGARKVEALFVIMIAVMCVCFGIEVFMAKPDFKEIALGFFFPRIPQNAMVQAVGVVGAVIMPHNLFLHSALVGTRRTNTKQLPSSESGDHAKVSSIREANFYATVESAIALLFSFIINATILVVFADIYGSSDKNNLLGRVMEEGERRLPGLIEAAALLEGAFGQIGPLLWAIGLLSSGQSSTATGTMAGQYLMEGMMQLRVSNWLRMFISRSISLIPTMLVGILARSYLDRFDEWLNVLQSLALPFALVPTLKLAQSSRVMTEEFALKGWWRYLGWVMAAAVIALNVYLICPLVLEMARWGVGFMCVAYLAFGLYLIFITVLVYSDIKLV